MSTPAVTQKKSSIKPAKKKKRSSGKLSPAFARRRARKSGLLLTRTAKWRARVSVLENTGESLSEDVLVQRAGWLQALVSEVAQNGLDEHWSEEGISAVLQPGLPSFAYRALEKVHGRLAMRAGVYIDSRAMWLAEELCGRTLRAAAHQRNIVTSLLTTGNNPTGTDKVSGRNARRAITTVIKTRLSSGITGPERIPTSFHEVRPHAPQLSRGVLPLACTDSQFARVSVDQRREQAQLMLKLPLVARPARRSDWAWHVLFFNIPVDTRERLSRGGALRVPSLRVRADRLLAEFPVEFAAGERIPVQEGSDRCMLALDWGERRQLSASILEVHSDGTVHELAGPFIFDAREAQAHMQRQREQAKHLGTLIARNLVLCKGQPSPQLAERLAMLETERTRIWDARAGVQNNLAHLAARWAIEVALNYDCHEIAVENLKTMEPRLRGVELRDRLNHQVRGVLFKHLKDKTAEAGLGYVEVNPKNTSAYCPRCADGQHQHVRAPDDQRSGRGWSVCRGCGASLDRDHSASLSIGAKALTDPDSDAFPPVIARESSDRALAAAATKSELRKITPAQPQQAKRPVRAVRSRHRRDPERLPARSRQRRRTINLYRKRRQRPEGVDSRVAVTPATQPVIRTRGTHCKTGNKAIQGFALARATSTGMPHSTPVST